MAGSRRFMHIVAVIACLVAAVLILNIETSIRQAVNGKIRIIKMPLWVKAAEFVTRDFEYQSLAREITHGLHGDREKVLAILKWTHDAIVPIPAGWPVYDDHILNIIIRRYGTADQVQDVFTTLSSYAGIQACWRKMYVEGRKDWFPLAFVKIDGRWRVFDAYYGKYFLNAKGDIATADDILADRTIIDKSEGINGIFYRDIPYKEFYYNLKPFRDGETTRSAKQMPLARLFFECRKRIGLEHETLATDLALDNGKKR